MSQSAPRGRGAAYNPSNRFEWEYCAPLDLDACEEYPEEQISPQTQVFIENAKTILTHNTRPTSVSTLPSTLIAAASMAAFIATRVPLTNISVFHRDSILKPKSW
jgi:hypothetical protein